MLTVALSFGVESDGGELEYISACSGNSHNGICSPSIIDGKTSYDLLFQHENCSILWELFKAITLITYQVIFAQPAYNVHVMRHSKTSVSPKRISPTAYPAISGPRLLNNPYLITIHVARVTKLLNVSLLSGTG